MTYKDEEERRIVSGVILAATLIAALVVTLGVDLVREPTLRSPHPINGRYVRYPAIRDDTFSRTCTVFTAYEDGFALATCDADHEVYRWDPAQERWSSSVTTR